MILSSPYHGTLVVSTCAKACPTGIILPILDRGVIKMACQSVARWRKLAAQGMLSNLLNYRNFATFKTAATYVWKVLNV